MKKERISVGTSDSAAFLAEKINASPAEEVVLIIPKFSKIAGAADNFELLKREIGTRKVLIESVDDDVLDAAEEAGFRAVNPLFAGGQKRKTLDIIAPHRIVSGSLAKEPPKEAAGEEENIELKEPEPESEKEELENSPETEGAPVRSRKKFYLAIILIAFFGSATYAAMVFLPQAEIKITTKKIPWKFDGTIAASKNAPAVSVAAGEIPGEIFTLTRNSQMSFPATGRKAVEEKAGGKLTVYNAFSSAPQKLVASTRFRSPESRIFRLDSAVTVPGAKVENGRIIPAGIEVSVTADAAGEEYNIPAGRFTIPGFEGTPKYGGFYAESQEPMTGGFQGEKAVPTDDDVKAAGEKVARVLSDALKSGLLGDLPAGFKVIDGASEFKVLKENVIAGAGASSEFSVFAEAQLTLFGFLEADLGEFLLFRAREELGDESLSFKSIGLEIGGGLPDFASGRMTFPVRVEAAAEKAIVAEEVKKNSLGKRENDLKTFIFALPGLDQATVSFWPRWVKTVPTDPKRVEVTVD